MPVHRGEVEQALMCGEVESSRSRADFPYSRHLGEEPDFQPCESLK